MILLHQFGNFNSQPHKEADLGKWICREPVVIFQLTASQGGWPEMLITERWQKVISTHSLTRRLTGSRKHCSGISDYFNSQPHKEADQNRSHDRRHGDISTHSLTRRLTSNCCWLRSSGGFQLTASQGGWPDRDDRARYHRISTHSLTRRLTKIGKYGIYAAEFQLTASQGGWQHLSDYSSQESSISTHSLTRRLTAISDKNIFIQNWFFYLLYILVLFFIQIIIF